MKTDKVSFGQTYIRPTIIQNIAEHNIPKVMSLVPLGEVYPADIYLGANKEGDLVVDILHSTLGKYLYYSDVVSKDVKNTRVLQLMDSVERIKRRNDGYNLPVYNVKVKNIDYCSIPELQYIIHEKLVHYYKNLVDKKFFD